MFASYSGNLCLTLVYRTGENCRIWESDALKNIRWSVRCWLKNTRANTVKPPGTYLEDLSRKLSAFAKERSGNTIIVFAVMLPVMIAGLAMVADFGLWRHHARQLQLQADTAAVAGAHEILLLEDDADVSWAARGLLHENGVDLSTTNVTVHYPPISGPNAGMDAVQVIISESQSRFFSALFLDQDAVVVRESTAVLRAGTSALCILALDHNVPAAFDLNGTADVNVTGCAIQSNSGDDQALQVSGTSSLTASCIYSSGGVYGDTKMSVTECESIKSDWRRMPDPYADLRPPANIIAMPCKTPTKTGKQSLFLESGRYCKSFSAMDYAELEEGGTFIFDGASIDLKSASSYLYGRDVTLIFVNGGMIDMPTGGMMDLSAKTSGYYAGILMYSDAATSPSDLTIKLTGHADSKQEGVMYFPNQPVEYTGGSSSDSTCTHLIARTITLSGNASFINQGCTAMGAREMALMPGVLLSTG